jgi:clan AA aspartic protease
MITGRVLNRRALLPVVFRLPRQPDLSIDFVVDTGFTDFLTLPATAIDALNLRFLYLMPADLADGSTISLAVHAATIV